MCNSAGFQQLGCLLAQDYTLGKLHWAFVEVLEITQRKLQTGFLLCSILLGKLITVMDKSCSYTVN